MHAIGMFFFSVALKSDVARVPTMFQGKGKVPTVLDPQDIHEVQLWDENGAEKLGINKCFSP